MFRFNDPEWLWALLLVPVLAALLWASTRSRRLALERFADTDLARKLTESVHLVARRWKAVLQVAAVALLAVALARPQFGSRVETVRSRGQDIVVAVDLSRSMLAEDVVPNRLDRARLSILRLMEQLDGDRIGLVAFAADAFVQSPLTVDYSAAGMFLGAMHPDLMPVQGTDLGAALRVSLDALEQGGRDARVLILVTDAEDHEASYSEELARIREVVHGRVQEAASFLRIGLAAGRQHPHVILYSIDVAHVRPDVVLSAGRAVACQTSKHGCRGAARKHDTPDARLDGGIQEAEDGLQEIHA